MKRLRVFKYLQEKIGDNNLTRANRIHYLCCVVKPELLELYDTLVAYPNGILDEGVFYNRELLESDKVVPEQSDIIDQALEILGPSILEMSLDSITKLTRDKLYLWKNTFDYGYGSDRRYVSRLLEKDMSNMSKEREALSEYLGKDLE